MSDGRESAGMGVRLALRQAGGDGVPARAPREVSDGRGLVDSHGRVIRDLRVSVTDRCNFRCVYCMDPGVRFAEPSSLMTAEEIVRVARVAESLGVRKIRLTGGEPTMRADLLGIIAGVRAATSLEIAMITNGSTVTREGARAWKRAGLGRVTVSIDSLREDRFAAITRSGVAVRDVLESVRVLVEEGLGPVKLNAVLIRGVNDDEAADLAGLALRMGVEVRFIEYMPLDSARAWDATKWVAAAETKRAIEARYELEASGEDEESSTARTYRFAGDSSGARVGFIAPVSSPFCGACSRLRLTADGKVRPCLFSTREWDLLGAMRRGAGDADIAAFLVDAVWAKQAGHGIAAPGFEQPARPMSAIGG